MKNTKVALLALTGVMTLAACNQDKPTTPTCNADQILQDNVCVDRPADTGSLVFPTDMPYDVVIKDAQGNIIPKADYATLAPGTYYATYSKPGYVSQTKPITVVAGQNAQIEIPTLVAVDTEEPVTEEPSGAYYVNAAGDLVEFTKAELNDAAQNFVFYAWLEDEKDGATEVGVDASDLNMAAMPTEGERYEVAPLGTQNLTAAYVGYRAPDGNVYPVVGASVRWDIVEDASQTNVRFATADDSGREPGATPQYVTNQAMTAQTFTNRAGYDNARFPSSTTYPLNNVTGVSTPDTDGFTWTALWVPRGTEGQATLTAVADINGTEINKTVLTKIFAPSAKLELTKVGPTENLGINEVGNFTITVTNTGEGPATNIRLSDTLAGGENAAYTTDAVAANGPATVTANTLDGFDATFDLQPGESRTFTLPASANEVGVYCDVVEVTEYANGPFGLERPNLADEACMTVTAPKLNIVKSLVDANGTPIATGQKVDPNTEVYAQITISNEGNAAATNVVVTDSLQAPSNAANYAIVEDKIVSTVPVTVDAGADNFKSAAFDLAPNETETFRFPAIGTDEGLYCDAASMTATSNNGLGLADATKEVCFEVVKPLLSINKYNTVLGGNAPAEVSLKPGSSYDSVITVTNGANATGAARGVQVSDILGNLEAPYNVVEANESVVAYGDGTYKINDGAAKPLTVNGSKVSTLDNIVLQPGDVLTVRLTSTVPVGTLAGEYCDVASYTSTNGGADVTPEKCIEVRNTISVATGMDDNIDPVEPDQIFQLTSYIAVEQGSNQGAIDNVIDFNFGSTDLRAATPGIFNVVSTQVRYNPSPVRDPETGAIENPNTAFANSVVLVEGTDYTINNTTNAQQTIELPKEINVGGIVYLVHQLEVPATAAESDYNSGFVWSYTGQNSLVRGGTSTAESTTVSKP